MGVKPLLAIRDWVLADKAICLPPRVLHFYSLALIVSYYFTRSHSLWQLDVMRPFNLCGKSCLQVYIVGSVSGFLWTGMLISYGSNAWIISGALIGGVALQFFWGWLGYCYYFDSSKCHK